MLSRSLRSLGCCARTSLYTRYVGVMLLEVWNGNTLPDIFFTQLLTTASHNLLVTDIRF